MYSYVKFPEEDNGSGPESSKGGKNRAQAPYKNEFISNFNEIWNIGSRHQLSKISKISILSEDFKTSKWGTKPPNSTKFSRIKTIKGIFINIGKKILDIKMSSMSYILDFNFHEVALRGEQSTVKIHIPIFLISMKFETW